MNIKTWIASCAAVLLLAGASAACIEALTLPEMVERTDAAIHGTITNVDSVLHVVSEDDRRIYTVLTIEGTDLYTGRKRTLEAAFLGGTHKGESMLVTCMPPASDYRLGNEILAFSAPVEGWGPEIDRCVYASVGGIFRAVNTPKGTLFLGKGEGSAVEKNTFLTNLQINVDRALRAKGGQR